MCANSLVQFVARSDVRRAALHRIAADPVPTVDLVGDLDAGRSAVYKAADALTDAGLVRDAGSALEPTGAGVVVADELADCEAVTGLLDADRGYWQRHDPGVLPRRFRRRLSALADAEVVRSPETYPRRARDRLRDLLAQAARVDAFVTVRDPEFAATVDDRAAETTPRLVFDACLVGDAHRRETRRQAAERPDDVAVRVADAPCSLYVTDDAVALRLPGLDGSYDDRAFLLAESATARQWGGDLFAAYWRDATPLAERV